MDVFRFLDKSHQSNITLIESRKTLHSWVGLAEWWENSVLILQSHKCGLDLSVLLSSSSGFPKGTPGFPSHRKSAFTKKKKQQELSSSK